METFDILARKLRTAVFTSHGRNKCRRILREIKLKTTTGYPLGRATKYRLRNGRYFVVHPQDALSFEIYARSSYEELETEFVTSLLHEGDALDIGANVGYFTALLSGLVKESGRIYSLEPGIQTYRKLLDTIRVLELDNVVAKQFVVGSSVGTVRFCESDTGMDQHQHIARSAVADPGFHAVEVPAITVDAFLEEQKINPLSLSLIKCDVEAHELEVLRGAKSLLFGEHPPVWMVEIRVRNGGDFDTDRLQELFFMFSEFTSYYAELGEVKIQPLVATRNLKFGELPELMNLFAFPNKGIHSSHFHKPSVQQWIRLHS